MDDYIRSRFLRAVELFNTGQFFECHEVLEDIWFDTKDKSSEFYQGLLHIAVAFYHLAEKKNTKGALLQIEKAKKKLAGFPNEFCGIRLNKLLKSVDSINKNLAKKKLPARFPKIELV